MLSNRGNPRRGAIRTNVSRKEQKKSACHTTGACFKLSDEIRDALRHGAATAWHVLTNRFNPRRASRCVATPDHHRHYQFSAVSIPDGHSATVAPLSRLPAGGIEPPSPRYKQGAFRKLRWHRAILRHQPSHHHTHRYETYRSTRPNRSRLA